MDDLDFIPPSSSSSSEELIDAVEDYDSPISSSAESEFDLPDTVIDQISQKVLALVGVLNSHFALELKIDERRDAADGMVDVLLSAVRDARVMTDSDDSEGQE